MARLKEGKTEASPSIHEYACVSEGHLKVYLSLGDAHILAEAHAIGATA
jgi:hypothetical protein